MNTFKASISDHLQFTLADHFAKEIHAMVVSMHCSLVSEYDHRRAEDIQEIRTFIRSIKGGKNDRYARQDFIRLVRYLFKKLREERGTEAKWQNYVAKVRQVHPEHITARTEAKLRHAA